MSKRTTCVFICAALGLAPSALASPPPGVDPNAPLSQWFNRQYNINGRSCCGLGDGHILDDDDVRQRDGHWEIRVEGNWYRPIRGSDPMTTDVRNPLGDPNPTGKAVAWWGWITNWEAGKQQRDLIIYCFLPPTQY